ncbi:MAG: ABC transporter ATP-binding protein [Desulfohalobiaceae bacterium]|nr:ABC transporter ATP-binding protein [Desulfohalobiaceae bacterium]
MTVSVSTQAPSSGSGHRQPDNLLEVNRLSLAFQTSRGSLKALRDVTLHVPKGSIVGVVGESGCGKSTLIYAVIKLLAANARYNGGQILFKGRDLLPMSLDQIRRIRGSEISMIFQDPMTALNPVHSIRRQMLDIQYRERINSNEKIQRAIAMLEKVGIVDAAGRLKNFPHHFSGGMRQRIAIAMALLSKPTLLMADEPTTALDATLEAQIIHRLRELQQEVNCSILFVSHHLGLVAEFCDRVVVMYAGEVVEEGTIRDIFHRAAHPYTKALLECDPAGIKEKTRFLPTISGDFPDLVNPPPGCIFQSRCRRVMDICAQRAPDLTRAAQGHVARCHLVSG